MYQREPAFWHGGLRAAACSADIPYGSGVHVPLAPLLIQFPTSMFGDAVEDGPSVGAPAATQETQVEFLAPEFSLAQHWPLWSFGNEVMDGRSFSLFPPLSLFLFLPFLLPPSVRVCMCVFASFCNLAFQINTKSKKSTKDLELAFGLVVKDAPRATSEYLSSIPRSGS